MNPIDRFKKNNTEGNLWIYILSLGKDTEVICDGLPGLIFERFGFLPSGILLPIILLRLESQKMISGERKAGKQAYKTTPKGLQELQKMKEFCQNLIDTI